MPKPYPKEFRDDVLAVARKGQAPLNQIAKDFGISEGCLHNWMKKADVADGRRPGLTEDERKELRELNERIRLTAQENEVLRRAAGYCRRPTSREASEEPHVSTSERRLCLRCGVVSHSGGVETRSPDPWEPVPRLRRSWRGLTRRMPGRLGAASVERLRHPLRRNSAASRPESRKMGSESSLSAVPRPTWRRSTTVRDRRGGAPSRSRPEVR